MTHDAMNSYEIQGVNGRKTPSEQEITQETSKLAEGSPRSSSPEWPGSPSSPGAAASPEKEGGLKASQGGRSKKKRDEAAQHGGEDLLDSQEEKQKIGKPKEQLKFRNAMKERLKVTKIPNLMLEEANGERYNFGKIFKFQNFLGTGTFGFVVSAIEKATGEVLALKIVDATQQNPMHSLQKEAEILCSLPPNDNVIEFKFIKEYVNYVIMGMEYAKAGTLLAFQRKYHHNRKHIKDEDCSKIIKGILLGLKHLHRNDFVHRDLKPSNVVLTDIHKLDQIKLVDFGLAVKYQTRQGLDETCGTLVYQAPEQMAGGQCYGKTVDVWAVGFIMYELIAGKHPLWEKGDNNETYKEKALNFTKLKFGRRFNKLSQGLLEKLCHPKPSLRYTVEQALQHPWITRNFQDVIPRNHFEQNMYLNDIDDKFRRVLNLVFTLSVIKNQGLVEGNKQTRYQMKKEKTAQPSKDENSELAHNRNSSALCKIKSYDDIKPEMFKDKDKDESEGSEDETFNRQITPFFQQNTKTKAKDLDDQFESKRASQISQRTDASKFEAMDSYLIGHIEQPSPKLMMERNKNKKLLQVNTGSKQGKIRMDSSADETSDFKSELTSRERGVSEGYSHMIGFASRNLANVKPMASLTIKAMDETVIKSIVSKNITDHSIESKPSSQRSIISLSKIHSTSVEVGEDQAPRPPFGEAVAKKPQGTKENSRTQPSFRIGKFQTKKQPDSGDKVGQGMSLTGEADRSQDLGDVHETNSPIKSAKVEPRGQSFGNSPNNVQIKIAIVSPKAKAENDIHYIQDLDQNKNLHSQNQTLKNTQKQSESNEKLSYQQPTEKKEYGRKLISSNMLNSHNQSFQDAVKNSKPPSEDRKADNGPKSKTKSDMNMNGNVKSITVLKESASGSDFERSGNEAQEQLAMKRTVDGQFTPVKVNIREIKKRKVGQTTSKKDRPNRNPHKVRVQTQIKRLSSKQGTIQAQPEGQMEYGKEPARANVQTPERNDLKQLTECESSRTQSTPVLRTNENSQLGDVADKVNDSLQNINYNQGSVKFKRKLTKANTTPTAVDDHGHAASKPSSPTLQQAIAGLDREQIQNFNSKSELRNGHPTLGQEQSQLKKLYAKSQLNEFASQMKNRSSSFIEKNRNIIQNGYPTQLSNMQQQMAQTGGIINPMKLQQMKSEIMTNQQKFRLSMNSQIPKTNNKAQMQQKLNASYYNNSNYEIIKHEGPSVQNPRGVQGSPNSYVSALPIRGLERFNHFAQPYAFKENGELKDNALNQYVQYQQFKVGAAQKVNTGSTRIQSNKGNSLLPASGTTSAYMICQSSHSSNNVTQQLQSKSQSPILASNFKMVAEPTGPGIISNSSLFKGHPQHPNQPALQNVSDNEKGKQAMKATVKIESTKHETGNDFSPFENFLLNLLQKNNDDQCQQSQTQSSSKVSHLQINAQQHQPYTSYTNMAPKRYAGPPSESRNSSAAHSACETGMEKGRTTIRKGNIRITKY